MAWDPYLLDYWGQSYADRIVTYRNKNWFVKSVPCVSDAASRERLAYLLGRNFANIAEVHMLSSSEFKILTACGLQLPEQASPHNTYLVRLGFDYSWLTLPVRRLDQAIAAELVYSIWIRRRDAHSFNRVYVHGIPVFYDHLTGLLGEPQLADLDKFFSPGPDAGYAAWWKINEIRPMRVPDILNMRNYERDIFLNGMPYGRVLFTVNRKSRMRKLFMKVASRIRRIDRSNLSKMAVDAGFCSPDRDAIEYFLIKSTEDLDEGIDRLCSISDLQ